jgi:hypothetical protein
MIKQAKDALQKNNFAIAQSMANQAYHQGELGYQQAMQQKNASFPDYLR